MDSPDSFILQQPAEPTGRLSLRAISSPGPAPPRVPLCPPGLLLGSGRECEVSLADPQVAPGHCLITIQGQSATLWALPGLATWVNGCLASRTELSPGDEIHLGQHLFLLEVEADPQVSPEPRTAELAMGSTRIGNSSPTPAVPLESLESAAPDMADALYQKGLLTAAQRDWVTTRRMTPFMVDEYEIQQLVGSGGMGWVYLARSTRDHGQVALKMLPLRVHPGIVSRLELEARAGVRLNHRNLVRTYSWRRTSEVVYLVMEWIEGVSLTEMVQARGPLPWPQVCDIAAQIALGLAAMHEQHMIHRDVKPANLLISREGVARLLDFGLTLTDRHHEAGEFSLAMIFGQSCLGTPDYMPPEQALDSFAVDHRADLYGLGCTMFFALTGELPYPGDSWEAKIQAHQSHPLPRLPDRVPHVVRKVVARLMAKRPDDRFASAAEVAGLLEPLAERSVLQFAFDQVLERRHQQTLQRIEHLYRTHSVADCPIVAALAREDAAEVSSDFELNVPAALPTQSEYTTVSLAPRVQAVGVQDQGIQELLTSWPHLPGEIRRRILQLIRQS